MSFSKIAIAGAQVHWILRFHATLLRGLTEGGMTIVRREAVEDRLYRRSNAPAVEMRFQGETLAFKFSEGYRRVRLTTSQLTKKRRETSWAREYETRPSGKFTFSIEGTEYQARKAWQGTQEKLQGLVDEVTRTAFQLAALQPQFRKERETREASARREQELRVVERG